MAAVTAMTALPLRSDLRRPVFQPAKHMAIRPRPLASGVVRCAQRQPQQQAGAEQHQEVKPDALLMLAAAMTPLLLHVEPAAAGNPLTTGKTVSLVHPAMMLTLLGVTFYTGLQGWNYRQSRLIPAEVKELKAQLPKDEEAAAASPLQSQIKELEQKRKELTKGDPRGKHFLWSSLLLGLGVTFGIVGPLNTYLRVGKLFPGPHLFAGAGIVVLWAIAASMVPLMSRGNDTARSVHIGANALTLGLFLWQVPTGIEIVLKVWQFAAWP